VLTLHTVIIPSKDEVFKGHKWNLSLSTQVFCRATNDAEQCDADSEALKYTFPLVPTCMWRLCGMKGPREIIVVARLWKRCAVVKGFDQYSVKLGELGMHPRSISFFPNSKGWNPFHQSACIYLHKDPEDNQNIVTQGAGRQQSQNRQQL
jgi:hypothetical protein